MRTEIDAQVRRREMVGWLRARGALSSAEWLRVFETVPRHVFVPRLFIRTERGLLRPVDGESPGRRAEWLAAAYAVTTQTTQVDGRPFQDFAPGVEVGGEPTSSATQPDVMAGMLEALEVRDGMRVLEIGTGTGYNAALLSERLGSSRVVSVEVDGGLAEEARRRLAACGYTPEVVTGDGRRGHDDGAPYDRVIATAAVPAVPGDWLRQAAVPGGMVLCNIAGGMNSGALALLKVTGPDRAEGRFLRWPAVYFMPVRSARVTAERRMRLLAAAEADIPGPRPSALGLEALEEDGFDLVGRLVLGDATRIDTGTDDGGWTAWLLSPGDGSAAAVTTHADGRHIVAESGPRRLWAAVEQAWDRWREEGRPPRERFRLTVRGERQHVRLDGGAGHPPWEVAVLDGG